MSAAIAAAGSVGARAIMVGDSATDIAAGRPPALAITGLDLAHRATPACMLAPPLRPWLRPRCNPRRAQRAGARLTLALRAPTLRRLLLPGRAAGCALTVAIVPDGVETPPALAAADWRVASAEGLVPLLARLAERGLHGGLRVEAGTEAGRVATVTVTTVVAKALAAVEVERAAAVMAETTVAEAVALAEVASEAEAAAAADLAAAVVTGALAVSVAEAPAPLSTSSQAPTFAPAPPPLPLPSRPAPATAPVLEAILSSFPKLCDAHAFAAARALIRQLGGARALLAELEALGFVSEGQLTTGTKPFNVFARVAAGVMSQPGLEVNAQLRKPRP